MRNGNLKDVRQLHPTLAALATEMPYLRINREKIYHVANALLGKQNYFRVIEREGEVVAILAALTNENLWAEKRCSLPIIWWSKSPGCGVRLLRDYRKWVDSRPVLRFAAFYYQYHWDDRVGRLLELTGFAKEGGAYLFRREQSGITVRH